MRCPFCGNQEDKVIDSRVSKDAREIRRRRECESCGRRFTTYERVEESMPQVVKRDGRREPFDRNKIERGIAAAAAKRPIAQDQIKDLAEDVEREVSELAVAEIASRDIGERVLLRLRGVDHIAYVRFASIYRDFGDLDEFAREVQALRAGEPDSHADDDADDVVDPDDGTDLASPRARRRASTDADVFAVEDADAIGGAGPGELTDLAAPAARRRAATDTESSFHDAPPDPTLETRPVPGDAASPED